MTDSTRTAWTRRRFLGAAAALPLVAGACADDGSEGGPSRQERESAAASAPGFSYGEARSQFGTLAVPDDAGGGLRPVVVLVHGGFWQSTYGLSLMDGLVNDVVARGWASWNLEYRRVGEDGGGWPGTFDDVAAGLDHLAALADEHRLDLDRVAVVGHSAGGHLAAWLASRPGLPDGSPGHDPVVVPTAVVSLAGVLDLVRASTDGLGGGATDALVGGTPADVADRYELGSPIERLPLGLPVRCVHGRADANVPFRQSEDFVAAADDAGDDAVELAPFDGDHFQVIDPEDTSWTDAADWLATHLDP